jgi:hypothetical protein
MTLILRCSSAWADACNKTGNLFVLDRENGKPVFGVDQIIIGADYPFPWNKVSVDHVLSISELSDNDRIAILGRSAAKLPGINCVKSGRRLHL